MGTTGRKVRIKYGTGSLEGFLSIDDVEIAGIHITGQFFIEADKTLEDETLKSVPFDGILGLGSLFKSRSNTNPVWTTMLTQHKISTKVFSIWLRRYYASGSKGINGGEIVFGGTVPEQFTGEHTFVTVDKDTYLFKMNNVFVGKKDTKICSKECPAFVDSGLSNILGPSALIGNLNREIGVAIDCKNANKLSDVTFTIAGKPFTLTPRDYLVKTENRCKTIFAESTKFDYWILGVPFIQVYHTVFDFQNPPSVKVGFAKSK